MMRLRLIARWLRDPRPNPRKSPDPRESQGGFTLIELMVAGTLTLLLMVVIGGTVLDSLRFADALLTRTSLNREARQIHDMLALGGQPPADQDVANYVAGVRGRHNNATTPDNPTATSLFPNFTDTGQPQYRLGLQVGNTPIDTPAADPPNTLFSSRVQARDVTCTDDDVPVSGCTVGATRTLHGRVEQIRTPAAVYGSFQSGYLIRLTEPADIGRRGMVDADFRDVVWMAFTLNREAAP